MPSPLASRHIHVFAPFPFWGRGPMETCYNICGFWPGLGVATTIHTSIAHHADPYRVLSPAVPKWLPGRIKAKINASTRRSEWLMRRAEAAGLAQVRPGDICNVWPGVQPATIAAAKAKGGVIVLEFINTHVGYARGILDAEYARVGAPPFAAITDAAIAEEEGRLALADHVFAPGPFVTASIRAAGRRVPRMLETSYGTHLPASRPPRAPGPLRFLFVGFAGVRKAAHILLDAWEKADLPAELQFAGGVEPWLAVKVAARGDARVKFLGYLTDIDPVYAAADVFVFPSLEEGGPQVVYEAAAHGLPLIVTAMGGGRIAAEGRNALIVPPVDAEALATALRRLHDDEGLRLRLGAQAAQDARAYAWRAVAGQRLEVLSAALA